VGLLLLGAGLATLTSEHSTTMNDVVAEGEVFYRLESTSQTPEVAAVQETSGEVQESYA
jgi:hypothetical protein